MAARLIALPDDPGLSLALAMVVSSTAPLLLLDGAQKIVAVSASFCLAFDIDPAKAGGRQLLDLGEGEWNVRQLRSLLDATASGDATIPTYEMDLTRAGQPTRRLVLTVQKLAYGFPDQMRLLVSVADVTEARLSDKVNKDLAFQNEILLQEVRHRVANSLQIIASVIMQNARRTQSEETRGHLRDAHQRVMSVADLQKQLAASTLGTVRLREYLDKLCASISASMVEDPAELSLSVDCDDGVIDAGVSVSLGLVVTELVINSLKHGFPEGRGGAIVVAYHRKGEDWTLSVADDGVGMPTHGQPPATGGLGTSIIQALARQLHAVVSVDAANPGTKVTLTHTLVVGQPEMADVVAV